MRRRLLLLALPFALWAGSAAPAAERAIENFGRVEIAPTKTSIYVGSVSMTIPTLVRRENAFESTYAAKVFPFFFSNETGRLRVDFTDTLLRKLESGEAVTFTGEAINQNAEKRRIEGKATPVDVRSGKIKVRVFVSAKIELIFNTTYRFPDLKESSAELRTTPAPP